MDCAKWRAASLLVCTVLVCAMKDDPARFPIGHVIAKSADRIRWSEVRADEKGVRRARASVLFSGFVRDSERSDPSSKDRRIEELESRLQRLESLLPHAAAENDRSQP